ncbi:MAG: NHLP bacteriocin system secretion protein [Alphaproteobacteria bacterium]
MDSEAENKIKFRQQALQHRYADDTATAAIPVFRYYSAPLLAVLSLVCSGAVMWGFFGSIPTWIQGEGILLPLNHSVQGVISPDGPGVVIALHNKPGDTVKQGDIIFTLDKPSIRESIIVLGYKLKNTQDIYAKMQEDAKKDNAERAAQIATQNEKLKKAIEVETEFQKNSEDLLKIKKGLQDKHLITNSEILAQRQNTLSSMRQVEEVQGRMLNNELTVTQLLDSWNDKLRNLELQILVMQNDIEVQQKQLELMKEVKSPANGTINYLHKIVGDNVIAGDTLATILEPSETLEVVSYVPAIDAELIEIGQRALVSPTIYKQEEYGNIEGTVTFISDLPTSPQEIMTTYKNEDLVKLFTSRGPTFKIKIKLTEDATSPNKIKWTSSRGPSRKLSQGTLVHAQVSIRERAPISLIMPAVRSVFGLDK